MEKLEITKIEEVAVTAPMTGEPKISLNAISVTSSSKTMIRFLVRIGNENVVILINSDNAHNF